MAYLTPIKYHLFMKLLLVALFFLLPIFSPLKARELKSFETDLCTYFPEGTRKDPMLWANCCILHDLRYWVGGTKKNRKAADLRLRDCVKKVAGGAIAELMYRGVLLGHYSPIKNKYQWSWGWREKDKFAALEEEDIKRLLEKVQESDVDPELIIQFILENNF